MTRMTAISLGWGIQSWTLAAMSALGELDPVDVALHSDTTWERAETYEFALKQTPWLEQRGVKVVTVREDSAENYRSDPVNVFIPARTAFRDGKPSGSLSRQCTERWKIRPIRRWLRSEGATQVEMWLGISLDEIHRAKDSQVKWITSRFPLLEKKMTRQDCINWLKSYGLPIPPKSSCVFCPYHTRRVWADMKREGGPDWYTAVQIDEAIRDRRPDFHSYLHPDLIPLTQVKIAEDFGVKQLSFVDTTNAECDSGYCFL